MWGSDQAASVEPHGFKRLVRDIRVIESALGDGTKRVYDSGRSVRRKVEECASQCCASVLDTIGTIHAYRWNLFPSQSRRSRVPLSVVVSSLLSVVSRLDQIREHVGVLRLLFHGALGQFSVLFRSWGGSKDC